MLVAVLVIGASGAGLMATQVSVASELPITTAVAICFLTMPTRRAMWVGGLLTVGAVVAARVGKDTFEDVAAIVLLCVTLALMGMLVRRSWEAQIATERLAAQLEDANEERAAAAALAERTRIARDLHDVLAQSLSGLAIQLEAARRVARRDGAPPQVCDLLDQAAGLTKEGLTEARRAVAALRGDSTASLEQLPGLVERYRVDLRLDVHLEITGPPRTLSALASEALLRGAQEALTNAARYARISTVRVELRYEDAATVLCVQDSRPPGVEAPAALVTGSGMGLKGMAERIGQAGGRLESGPTADGWRVMMEVPA
jgi:signal transduction histidine kinase